MQSLDTEQIAKWARGKWFRAPAPDCIHGFAFDSRSIAQGDIFVALRTGKRDGHEFLGEAEKAGACAAIVEHRSMRTTLPQLLVDDTLDALHRIAAGMRKEFREPVVGITGSCGKTSTKELLTLLLGEGILSTQGNLNNFIGMPLTLTRLRSGLHKGAVVELGISRSGEMEPLAKILRPDIAVVTNVTEAHLEGLGSIEGVALEKCALAAVVERSGRAVFPASCLQWEPFRELRCKVLVTASMDEATPELPAPNYSLARYQSFHSADSAHIDILIFMPGQSSFSRFTLPLVSQGMRSNVALALAVALDMGVDAQTLRERLPLWKAARMRGEVRNIDGTDYYIDCYNANPASMQDAVQLFRERFPERERLLILGCMNELGPKAAQLHRDLGRKIGFCAGERFCLVGPNAGSLCEGLLEAGAGEERISICAEHSAARAVLEQFHNNKGAVLLKGSRSYCLETLLPQVILS